jgi:hypothetical protein
MHQSLSLSEYLRKKKGFREQKHLEPLAALRAMTRKATPHCRKTQPQQPQERGLVPARRKQQQQKVF